MFSRQPCIILDSMRDTKAAQLFQNMVANLFFQIFFKEKSVVKKTINIVLIEEYH